MQLHVVQLHQDCMWICAINERVRTFLDDLDRIWEIFTVRIRGVELLGASGLHCFAVQHYCTVRQRLAVIGKALVDQHISSDQVDLSFVSDRRAWTASIGCRKAATPAAHVCGWLSYTAASGPESL